MVFWTGVADVLKGPESPVYREYPGGPLVARCFNDVTPGEVAEAVQELRAATLALMEQEGASNPLDLLRVGKVTTAHHRVRAATDRLLELFVLCDGFMVDWTGGQKLGQQSI